jgi:hypothetical protein
MPAVLWAEGEGGSIPTPHVTAKVSHRVSFTGERRT